MRLPSQKLALRWIAVATAALSLGGLSSAQAAEPAESGAKVDFVADIQPLLQKHCYSCHGGEMQEGGLRLDVRARAMQGGDNGAVIVPSDPAASRLIKLLSGTDDELGIMPPDGEGAPLEADQIALVRRWIEQGAEWPDSAAEGLTATDHWSFQPIRRPGLPAVADPDWVRNPIDRFVLARLDKEGVKPAAVADRATLIRRVFLDMLGLPPSPEQVQEFLEDTRPDAYERMLDRVLASPHYGERWGRHWLDLARYADSDGYEKDRPRPNAWRYRSWVINALNSDMPFDQFSIRQIAGDLLPEADQAARVASGFHRNTLHNTEGGTDPEEDRVKKTVDRTNTVGTIWLGLTVGCAQCHTHKYDPITHREYYSMYALFNNMDEQDVPAPTPLEQLAHERALEAHRQEASKLQAALDSYVAERLPKAQAAWEQSASANAAVWQPIEVQQASSAHGAELKRQEDGSLLAAGPNEASDRYTLEAVVELPRITALRLEVLPDKSLVKEGPGRANNGNFVLTTFGVEAAAEEEQQAGPAADVTFAEIELTAARADFSQKGWTVEKAINADDSDGWAVSPEFGKRHVAVFEPKQPIEGPRVRLRVTLDQTYSGTPHNLGRFRLSAASSPTPVDLEGLPAEVAKALAVAPAERTAQQQAALSNYYQTLDSEYQKLRKQLDEHAKKAPSLAAAQAQAVVERSEPREAHVHLRGDFLSPGDAVDPGTLAVLPPLHPRGDRPDRLDFARWLFEPDHPLTARVTVNRVWQRIFGRGLVVTSDDFGKQGERPSHPELLDWLASELPARGWSLKQLHRLILNSATYRQSSAVRPELVERDPENALLARQSRRRVESEVVRDLALAASGLLDPRLGGPSVRPPQPAEYSELTYAGSAQWSVSAGGDAYRRGLYTFFQRTSPYPMLITFDSPNSTECVARRPVSNTPLQSLTLWNDPVFFEAAQSFGRRVVQSVPASDDPTEDFERRLAYAFQLCLARPPAEYERVALRRLFDAQWQLCRDDSEAAKQIVGSHPVPEGVEPARLAAWIMVGRTLMNLDGFIMRE